MGSAADQQRHAEEILREFLSESLRCRPSRTDAGCFAGQGGFGGFGGFGGGGGGGIFGDMFEQAHNGPTRGSDIEVDSACLTRDRAWRRIASLRMCCVYCRPRYRSASWTR